jgi:frataxin-like iron-binding protein CyaY
MFRLAALVSIGALLLRLRILLARDEGNHPVTYITQSMTITTDDGGVLVITADPASASITLNANRAGDFNIDAADWPTVERTVNAAFPSEGDA